MISLFAASKYKRKLTETVPAGVYLFMLLIYLLGISGHIGHITGAFILYELFGGAALLYLVLKNKNDIRSPFMDPGNLILIVMPMIFWFISLHMRVTNFDDFHYWAIMPKDMFYVDGVPTGGMASTFYRDYFPPVQYMDYFVFKLQGSFSESSMFFTLWTLMLSALSEFFHKREDDDIIRYLCRAAAGLMLPFLMSFQFLHCLGTDILATVIFGESLVYIMEDDTKDIFAYIRIVLAVTLLAMMKTTSLILAAVCIGVYFVKNTEFKKPNSLIRFLILSVSTGSFWLSWKVFCRIKGNTTYLSDNLDRNLAAGHGGLPEYTASTVKAFLAKLFTYGLNDGTTGLTSVIILILFVLAFIIFCKEGRGTGRKRLSFAVILAGMAGYLLVMIYIYLFVFEEWEALSLSSYDRYISTYFGALLYAALYMFFTARIRHRWIAPAFVLLLACTINFSYVAKTLIPAGFEREYGEAVSEIDSIEREFLEAAGERPAYGESILIVDYTTEQLRAKVLPYAAVPGVVRIIRPDEETGVMPTEQEIEERAGEYGARVIDLRAGGKAE